jgi:superfamily II DNA or RNA helicase
VTIATLRFDRGTLCIEGAGADAKDFPSVLWDERIAGYRAPAYAASAILEHAAAQSVAVAGPPWPASALGGWTLPPLRDYQQSALDAWGAFGRRGIVVIPTGGGKTRVAIAALAKASVPSAVLCPTRVLLDQWRSELASWFQGPIGIIGDGEHRVEALTVMTFESAYRRMDEIGDRFTMLVIDEVHHFSGGTRAESLEMSTAPVRLGLTATAPPAESSATRGLLSLVGPVVSEIGLGDLLGKHLADLEVTRLAVRLTAAEGEEYLRSVRPFDELRAAFARASPGADWASLMSALGRSAAGRSAIAGFHRAVAVASFPEAKRTLAAALLRRHYEDKVLVFTAGVDAAYRVARDCLVPVLTAHVSRGERESVLARFRDGRLRAIVSSRVLNEGLNVPDARVAILIGGALGTREFVQRIGRVLRPAAGKRAQVYELVTSGTIDDRRAEARRRRLVAGCAALT